MSTPRILGWIFLASCLSSYAQQAPAPPTVDNDFVQKAFGFSCTTLPKLPAMAADLNGDGVDDLVIPARCTEPMRDAGEHEYKVLDPRNAFYGLGNPTITTQYSTEIPEDRSLTLLIINGEGKDAWRSATPKGKFLIVNLAFKDVVLRKLMVKKKSVVAIYVTETSSDQTTSALFWDGKKYKYQPVGASMQ